MKVTKKRLKLIKRFEKKNKSEEEKFKIKNLFVEKHLSKWIWGIGLVVGLSLTFLLSSPKQAALFINKTGMIILVILFVSILSLYLFKFWSKFLLFRPLSLLGILIISMVVIGGIIIVLPQVSNYFIPLAFLSILVSLLFVPALSIIVTLLLAILFSISTRSLEILPVLAVGGMVGAYSASFVHQRTDLTKSGLYVGLANVFTILAVSLLANYSMSEIIPLTLWGMGSGLFSSILATVVLPYLETYFGVITDIKLLELSNFNSPLLNRLTVEAPGTHHHTIMVASLAEVGAEAIDANSLLTRVGAYYHDIGKIIRPHFFFENSKAGGVDYYHSQVSPNLSSVIIISHVKDGLELAKIFRLPQVVIDIIAQHHGTGLIAYFYRKALLETKEDDSVDESNFRYPGPKPKTKEATIVMLADSVAADFRFSSWKSPKGIKARIQKVINNKLKDHQLDEADLSLRDVNLISEAFTRVLTGLSHARKRYPEEMLDNEKRNLKNQQYVGRKGSRAYFKKGSLPYSR